MVAGLIVLIVLQVLSIIANIMMVGKPRTPTTPGLVATSTVIGTLIIAFYIALIYVVSGT
jgi:hypothetical protein